MKKKQMDEKELQHKYMEFQVLQQQIEQISQQLQALTDQHEELEKTKQSLNELKDVEKDTEMFSQISAGIFVKSKLSDKNNLLITVGSQTGVEKTVPETIALVDEQEKKVAQNIREIDKILQKLSGEAVKIYEQIQPHVQ